MTNNLTTIPRVKSESPGKNTIEWEISGKVGASLMSITGIGYIFIAKVKKTKSHWWNKSWKNYSKKAADPASAVFAGLDFLEKYGYTIDHNSIEFGEKIGTVPKQKYNNHTNDNDDDLKYFKANVENWEIIEKNGGTLPIQGQNIGEISIDNKSNKVKIEIKQTAIKGIEEDGAWYQVPYYGHGFIICENIKYEIKDTDINGGVFVITNGKQKPGKLKVMANYNRKGIEISCDKIKVLSFEDVNVSIEEFKVIDIGCKTGRFFNLSKK